MAIKGELELGELGVEVGWGVGLPGGHVHGQENLDSSLGNEEVLHSRRGFRG